MRLDTIALDEGGAHIRLTDGKATGVSAEDAAEYRGFRQRMTRYADLLATYLTSHRRGSVPATGATS